MITDEAATKPEDWLENEPELIPDPEAEKPEEWDVSAENLLVGSWLMCVRTRRTVTGSPRLCPTPSARRVLAVDPGPSPRSRTRTTR